MPTLPTLTVTQSQADRMLAAYAPYPGATQAETIDAYKEWLRAQIVRYVSDTEVLQVRQTVAALERDKATEVANALPKPPPPPAPA